MKYESLQSFINCAPDNIDKQKALDIFYNSKMDIEEKSSTLDSITNILEYNKILEEIKSIQDKTLFDIANMEIENLGSYRNLDFFPKIDGIDLNIYSYYDINHIKPFSIHIPTNIYYFNAHTDTISGYILSTPYLDGKIMCVVLETKDSVKFAFVNKGGSVMISDKMDKIPYKHLEDKLFIGVKDGVYGVVNDEFTSIIPYEFQSVALNNGEYIIVQNKESYLFGYYDFDGVELLPCIFRDVSGFSNGEAYVKLPNMMSEFKININGEIIK